MKGYLISIWSFIDPIYYFCTRLTYLPCEEPECNIFRVRLTKYKGRNVVLSDGTRINKNDTLVKIHLHNVRLLKELKNTKSDIKKAKIIYHYVEKSLPSIELYIRNQYYFDEIKGIIGITLLNKGCERLGFEIFDISHPLYKRLKQFSFLPIKILSSQNSSVRHILKSQQPKYLFMSTKKLSNLYGHKSLR
jgi:hypothetical protein